MQVPIENKGASPIYVGGMMIPPGETRHLAEDDLPPEYRRSATAPVVEDEDPIAELLEGNVAEVTGALDLLNREWLVRMEAMELAGKNRKGVLAAIAEEMLRRANNSAADGGEG
ncbi:MAG: hypothetical protein MUE63_00125 [Xanthomonadales bacterium]|jgi:hypothetical protein|nr:hypothetical protein [Xanthomonadales bacterium]